MRRRICMIFLASLVWLPMGAHSQVRVGESEVGKPEPTREGQVPSDSQKLEGDHGVGLGVQVDREPGLNRARPPVESYGDGVETASSHGIVIEPGTIAMSSGTFLPDPGIDGDIIQRIERDGGAHALIQIEGPLLEGTFHRLHQMGIKTWAVLPHQAIQAYIPEESLAGLSALAEVRWVGTLPTEFKVHPALEMILKTAPSEQPIPAWVALLGQEDGVANERPSMPAHASDFDAPERTALDSSSFSSSLRQGSYQRLLESMGIGVHFYREMTRNFAVSATPGQLRELSRRNDIHFLSDRSSNRLYHDSSIPLVGQDSIRWLHDGFSTEVGVIDTGLNNLHTDFNILAVAWDTSPFGPYNDTLGHGTHVTGTMLGNGIADNRFGGAAPGIGDARTQRLFVGRYFDNNAANPRSIGDVNDLYNAFSSNFTDSNGFTTIRPKIVNCSWGSDPPLSPVVIPWSGTEQECIDVDNTSWNNRQLYVFAAGNRGGSGAGTIGRPAVAKNVLTVGNVRDDEVSPGDNRVGTIFGTSARGPTGDNRMKPEITAPGHSITSTDTNNVNGYTALTGTSMATPHVTGLLASLNDHYQILNNNPKLYRAWALASSLKKGGNLAPNSTYGFGTINATRMHHATAHSRLIYLANEYVNEANRTFSWIVNVPPGTDRITLVVTWDEPGLSTPGGATPVMGNIDVLLDYNNDQSIDLASTGNSNYQFIIVENPPAGDHRITFDPRDTDINDNGTIDNLYFSAALNFDYTDTRPRVALATTIDDVYLRPGDDVEITSVVSSPSHVASSTMLNLLELPVGLRIDRLEVPVNDGRTLTYPEADKDVVLGAIPGGSDRQATWTARALAEGTFSIKTKANNDNGPEFYGHSAYNTQTIYVDGTDPSVATNLRSSTHQTGVWTDEDDFVVEWDEAEDDRSGIAGYSVGTPLFPLSPDTIRDLGPVNSYSKTLSEGTHYFTIRSEDRSGNWDDHHVYYGPVRVDRSPPSLPTNFVSNTHPVGVYRSNSNFSISWDAAHDSGSGLDGYGIYINSSPTSSPSRVKDIEEVTQYSETLGDGTYYFKLRPVDNLGQFSSGFGLYGPIKIDTTAPSNPSIVIDSGRSYTLDRRVDLTLSAADAASGVSEMRFSSDGSSFSPWESFSTERAKWDLSLYGGSHARGVNHEVFAQFRDEAGNRTALARAVIYFAEDLSAAGLQVSRSNPQPIDFSLFAGPAFGGRTFLLLGTVSGTSPGIEGPFESGGTINVPLNRDGWTRQTLRGGRRGEQAFSDFRGELGADGSFLGPVLDLEPGSLSPDYVGKTMHFAFVILAPGRTVSYVSQTVSLQVVD